MITLLISFMQLKREENLPEYPQFRKYQVSTNIAAVALIVFATFVFSGHFHLQQHKFCNQHTHGWSASRCTRYGKEAWGCDETTTASVDEGLPNGRDLGMMFFLDL